MLLRALLVAFVAACVVGCTTMGSCNEYAVFSTSPNSVGVNISGYEAFDCTVTFSSQGRTAVTVVKAGTASTTAPPPATPTLRDDLACKGFVASDVDAQYCTQTSGPAPGYCARSATCLRVVGVGDPGTGMDAFLGATGTYDLRVECGGIVLATLTNLSSRYQQCVG